MKNTITEIRTGYKETKLGCIPEDWEVLNLEDCSYYRKGYAFKSEAYIDSGIRIIRVSDTDANSIKKTKGVYVDPNSKDKYSKWQLKCDDLIFTTVGSRPPMYDSMVGKVIKVDLEYEGTLLNQNAVRIRSNSMVFQNLLIYFFKQKRYLNYIETIVRGNANQVSITLNDLFKFKLPIPPLPEQKAIATCLSTWNTTITKLDALIKAKQQLKKALMQQLLSGKKRLPGFDGEWESLQFSDITERVKRKNSEADDTVVTISAQRGFVLQEDFFNKRVASDTLLNYTLVHKGEYCYNKSYSKGYPMGAFKRLDDFEKAVVTTLYICFSLKDNVDSDFMNQYFDAGKMIHGLMRIAQEGGRAHGLLNISLPDFFSLPVKLPILEEQNAIAQVLNTAYQEINLLTNQRNQLQLQKKGLMQQLLSGNKRLQING